MKPIYVLAIFFCVTFSVFSQSANSERYKALSDSMDRTISNSNYRLEDYDEMASDSGGTKTYTYYNRRHESLKAALSESERRLDLLIRTNDRNAVIKEERDNYERLIRQLEQVKSDYDNWLRTVQ